MVKIKVNKSLEDYEVLQKIYNQTADRVNTGLQKDIIIPSTKINGEYAFEVIYS